MTPKEQSITAALWWRELQPRDVPGRRLPGDRAALARLRRAATPLDAVMEPATLDLCGQLGARPERLERFAIAALLAEVREDAGDRTSLARQVGAPPGEGRKPLVSELRFRRAVAASTDSEMLTGFRRLIAQAGRRLDLRDLAESLLDWSDARRRRWLYDYYHTNTPASAPVSAAAAATEDATA